MVLAASLSSLYSSSLAFLTSSALGYALLGVGIISTLLSSQRYLLLYFLGGMGYWLSIEFIQSGLVETFTISVWHSYVAALAITWLIPAAWVTYRLSRTSYNDNGAGKKSAKHLDSYIEHTPIYENYKPRFPNYPS